MRPDYQLRVFNVEVTAYPGIAPPPRPHNWPTVLVLLFGTSGKAVFGGVPLSPFVTLAGQGQGHSRRCLPAVWTFLICPRTFFFLGMGLGLDMKWARVARPFGLTFTIRSINSFLCIISNYKNLNLNN